MQLILVSLIYLILAKPAHAYLDPGSGSLFFQVLIAGLLSSLFMAKSLWKRLIRFITSLFSHRKPK
ncbi:MAG: hypothetical protein UV61_C0008G0092 [Candidatus Gottesmanbacteria bacterium GW2011_GWB1_43_11]|uniref:Uncharacterized protein n=1 Tax=Candidatus Gottesmanbacteria bacterium GW2011_GWB1_43_11 TaxID=1618446 RepID=A0A0G1CMB1_9BACT|nr:MAG: hypothetical protein UV04_C0009G0076 [Candidatus Gottesmanbacteria bacterium GW2011_GWA2_42_16]KKS54933.1 MAG: hypothetical protein UV17_C0014G0016 [Candidatus Gottesmanbacteria bacterium GW2011_GWA1_42_26]KKS82123.1 MAG: hypothetical protein UV55_C0005G0041 [Candidatus Gottesmanbacteria bacterium GW2011_GWC1_43_10]KKS86639.1 MAG: hypothetical protein UV61_C0008G0092 [Candidatus Gottesmanbacteria bacterium GW2011_GWB1_43_11]OGG10584.1 MAG: hypothetical protein A2699_02885 [Candidatus Go